MRRGYATHHGEDALLSMLELEVLIRELRAVDGLAASSITVGEVTTLDHERLDNAVKGGALVSVAVLAGRQLTIFCELFDSESGLNSSYRKFSAVCRSISHCRNHRGKVGLLTLGTVPP
jgi:hypothetical protein